MKKSVNTISKEKSSPKSKYGNKVDFMIKFNPDEVFEVCSACKQDMKWEYQRPLALFARNGTDAVCWRCGWERVPEYVKILSQFYEPVHSCFPGEYHKPLEDLRENEHERTMRVKRQRRRSLIKKIIAMGFTKNDIDIIVECTPDCEPDDDFPL